MSSFDNGVQPMSLSSNDLLNIGNYSNFGSISKPVSTAPVIPTKQTVSYNIPLVGQGTYQDYKTNKHSYVGWYIFFFIIFLIIIVVLVVALTTSHEKYKSTTSSPEQGFMYSLDSDMTSTITRKGFVNDSECQNNPHVALNGPKRCLCETGWTGQYCGRLDMRYLHSINDNLEYAFLGVTLTIPDTDYIADTDATANAINSYLLSHPDVRYILVDHQHDKVYFMTLEEYPTYSLESVNALNNGPFLYQITPHVI